MTDQRQQLRYRMVSSLSPLFRWPNSVNHIWTPRGQDDEEAMYNLLGTKECRRELDKQFKNPKSNFKIAIVVDMWLTGFDVPELDTIYIDKPLQKHNLNRPGFRRHFFAS